MKTDRQTDMQTLGRQTGKQAGRHTGTQANKQTARILMYPGRSRSLVSVTSNDDIQMVCLLTFCVYVAQEQRADRTQRYPHVPNVSFSVCLLHCDAVRNVQNCPGRLGYFPHSFRIQLPRIFFRVQPRAHRFSNCFGCNPMH